MKVTLTLCASHWTTLDSYSFSIWVNRLRRHLSGESGYEIAIKLGDETALDYEAPNDDEANRIERNVCCAIERLWINWHREVHW